MPSPFPEIETWGTIAGAYQYVITYNKAADRWQASTRLCADIGGHAISLGAAFVDEIDAKSACEQHYRAQLS
jgi:hypothetical protein